MVRKRVSREPGLKLSRLLPGAKRSKERIKSKIQQKGCLLGSLFHVFESESTYWSTFSSNGDHTGNFCLMVYTWVYFVLIWRPIWQFSLDSLHFGLQLAQMETNLAIASLHHELDSPFSSLFLQFVERNSESAPGFYVFFSFFLKCRMI